MKNGGENKKAFPEEPTFPPFMALLNFALTLTARSEAFCFIGLKILSYSCS